MDTQDNPYDYVEDEQVEAFEDIDDAIDAYERHLIHMCSDDCEFCLAERPRNGTDLSISLS